MISNQRKFYIVESIAILIGILYALVTYISALDGEFYVGSKVNKTYYEATEPEAFSNAVGSRVSFGLIVAGAGVIAIFLQKESNRKKQPNKKMKADEK